MEKTVELKTIAPKKRFWELDFIRGLCVILMIFDHLMFSIWWIMPEVGEMLGTDMWDAAGDYIMHNYWNAMYRNCAHTIVVFIFFVICGTCCSFSRSNIGRGIKCFAVGCMLTFFTTVADAIFNMGISIYFGVLHMLGISMMLYGLIDKVGELIARLGKTDEAKRATKLIGTYLAPAIGLILLIIYFSCWGTFEDGLIGCNVMIEDRMSSVVASLFLPVKYEHIEWIIGGSDYWPLLPYSAMVLLGGFLGRGLYCSDAKNYLAKLDGKWNKPVCFVGRHAIVFYVLHQVAVLVILFLITVIFG